MHSVAAKLTAASNPLMRKEDTAKPGEMGVVFNGTIGAGDNFLFRGAWTIRSAGTSVPDELSFRLRRNGEEASFRARCHPAIVASMARSARADIRRGDVETLRLRPPMNFELPEEIALLQKTVRRFVEEELMPLEKKVPEADELPRDVQARLESKTKELGLWLLEVPQEYGGAGLSCLAIAVIYEEVSRSSLVPFRSSGIFGPKVGAILLRASDEQKERYLFPLIRGEKRACFAMTEPHAGSDPASMRTTAVPDGDHYVLNGIKTFITAADKCDFAQVFALTDPSKRADRKSVV